MLFLSLFLSINMALWCIAYFSLNITCSCSLGLFMSTLFYIGSVGGIVLMYVLYASKASCTLNIFFISWTGILLAVMMVISLHSKVTFQRMQSQYCLFHRYSKVYIYHQILCFLQQLIMRISRWEITCVHTSSNCIH